MNKIYIFTIRTNPNTDEIFNFCHYRSSVILIMRVFPTNEPKPNVFNRFRTV